MIELLKKYISEGSKSNALLVAQNLFNKNKGDKEFFSQYFSLLLDAAESNHGNSEKFIGQAITVLSVYSENTDLDEGTVNYIRQCELKLNSLVSLIRQEAEGERENI